MKEIGSSVYFVQSGLPERSRTMSFTVNTTLSDRGGVAAVKKKRADYE